MIETSSSSRSRYTSKHNNNTVACLRFRCDVRVDYGQSRSFRVCTSLYLHDVWYKMALM